MSDVELTTTTDNEPSVLDRDAILGLTRAPNKIYRTINGFRLQSLNGLEKLAVKDALKKAREAERVKSGDPAKFEDEILLTFVLVDEKGERLFKVSEAEQLAKLETPTTQPLIGAAWILAGFSSTNIDKYLKNLNPPEDTN